MTARTRSKKEVEPIEDVISLDTKELILNQQLEMWFNTQYQAEINHRVAKKLKDDALIKDAVDQATRCEIAIAEIQVMMVELKENNGDAAQ